MNKKLWSLLACLFGFLALITPGEVVADIQARFEYGCEPRTSSYAELTCTFDGSSSTSTDGLIQGYRWYFRRYSPEDRESETATRTGVRVTHTYTQVRARHYTYYATLEVTDSLGDKHTHTEQVDPSRRMDPPPENQRPVASFGVSCTFLDCVFDASASYDPDGTIASYTWSFGDGNSGSGPSVAHTYAASGTYTVYLTVADNSGATGLTSKSVSVAAEPPPPPDGFLLSATGSRVRGGRHVGNLSWTGALSANVDLFRNGAWISTAVNSGSYNDAIGAVGRGTYKYLVCEAGTSICSNEATVVFD
jgi:PKD repeat protein